jgi:YVTN family beta-propeller protein
MASFRRAILSHLHSCSKVLLIGAAIWLIGMSTAIAQASPAGGNPPASAQVAPQPTDAPLSPRFVDYLNAIKQGPPPVRVTRDGHPLGSLPSPLDLSHLKNQPLAQTAIQLPSSYDLRTEGKVTPVRDQGLCNACWDFAAIASLESALLPGETRDFSENNMMNLHGFDYAPCLQGGNYAMALAYLTRWAGPVNESDDPYDGYGRNPSPTGLAPQKHVQDAIFIPVRANSLDNDALKSALMTYGALFTSMAWDDSAYNAATAAYYYAGSTTDINHDVTLVGWDDNYNKSNFNTPPPGDGAFLIKNSWGTGFGQAGYFWISYYDVKYASVDPWVSLAFAGNENITEFYTHRYEYDTLGWFSSTGYSSYTGWFASIFTATDNQSLRAVSTIVGANTSSYDIKVYTGANSGPTSGTLAETVSGTFASAGYHTVVLPTPIPLPAGQHFSVVVGLTTPGYTFPIPYQQAIDGYSSKVTASPGQTYQSPNGTSWTDATSGNPTRSISLKAFSISSSGPMATTSAADSIATTYATVNGVVNPNGGATTYWFEYGTSDTNLIRKTSQSSLATGYRDVGVSIELTGLRPNTLYYYRLAASNSLGTNYGSVLSFTTATAVPGVIATVTGIRPQAVAVNSNTNQIYVANYDKNVTVIDGVTNATTTVPVGYNPQAVAINTVTNKIYVANADESDVTVIDGATNATSTVAVGTGSGTAPQALGVNTVSNKIYVANYNSDNVTVIDGVTNGTANVAVGSRPKAVGVNAVTNKIYVANFNSNYVTVINGATNATTKVTVGSGARAVGVNAVTNKIYVANSGSSNVTVIDGTTNATTTVPAGDHPWAVAVNTVTNKVYVANYYSNNVTVIDGATNAAATVPAGSYPYAVAVNSVTNNIYVPNYGSNNVTVIEGATNVTTTTPVGQQPVAVAVNPVTNRAYVVDNGSNEVSVIYGDPIVTQVLGLSLNPATLVGGGNSVGTITLSNPAPAGGVMVVLSSDNAAVQVPASVAVPSGSTGASFSVTTSAVDNPVVATVTATLNDAVPAQLTLNVAGSPPAPATSYASSISDTGATLNGNVNPNGPATAYWFEYGTSSTDLSGKSSQGSLAAGNGDVGVSIAIGGLNPKTLYYYRVAASNVLGTNYGSVLSFTTGTSVIKTVAAGTKPWDVAVNPNTNKIYVANYSSNNVTVIDGATNATTTVPAGTQPKAVAVNADTNKIYVANYGSSNVTVIDGATNTTTTVPTGSYPKAVAVNPATNKIYVPTYNNSVTVIDGATNTTTTTVPAGNGPSAVAVNPVTNKIYVVNASSTNVTVIDGATNATTTVPTGAGTSAVAVNSVTNKIYVANQNGNSVTVIDGATNTTTTITVPTGSSYPYVVAVNPVTNRVYVLNSLSNDVTVIDGVTNATVALPAGTLPKAVAVNPDTNKIYVANNSNDVTVIDGATNTTTTLPAGHGPIAVAVNPNTNKIYIANQFSNDVTVIEGQFGKTNSVALVLSDFDGDHKADLNWHNDATGDTQVWRMNGTTVIGGMLNMAIPDTTWRPLFAADFNGDSKADILWHNSSSGANYLWQTNSALWFDGLPLEPVNDSNWQIIASADFDGDGKADLVWRNSQTGDNYVWLMNGSAMKAPAWMQGVAGTDWKFVTIADFNGDGHPDMLWFNVTNGVYYAWLMNGTTIVSGAVPGTNTDPNWQLAAIADFNGDGRAEILWRNVTTGANYMWMLNSNGNFASGAYVEGVSDLNWQIVAVGDLDGDGRADLVWRNTSTGANYVWFMNGATLVNSGGIPAMTDQNWKLY